MWVRFCLRACVIAPITSQKPFCFSSVAFSAVAKTGPFPCCLSAANGGAGVGLPGHVSGWWPCQSNRKRCTTKLTVLVGGRDMRALWKQPVPCGKVMWYWIFPYCFKNEFDGQFHPERLIFSPLTTPTSCDLRWTADLYISAGEIRGFTVWQHLMYIAHKIQQYIHICIFLERTAKKSFCFQPRQ